MVAIEITIRFAELLVIIQRGVFQLCTVRLTFRVWRSDHDCSDRFILVAGDKCVRKEETKWMQIEQNSQRKSPAGDPQPSRDPKLHFDLRATSAHHTLPRQRQYEC